MSTITLSEKDFSSFRLEFPSRRKDSSLRVVSRAFAYVSVMALQTGVVAFLSLSSILGGMKAYDFFHHTDYFHVRRVTVSGLDKLTEAEVLSLAGVRAGQDIFGLDLKGISKNLVRNPWVKSAMVRRELPDGLVMEITERRPFARVRGARGTSFLIDDRGYVMAEISGQEYRELPVITGASRPGPGRNTLIYPGIFMTGLNLLRFSRASSLFRDPVEGLRIEDGNTLILKTLNQKTEIRVDGKNLVKKLSRLEAIYDYAKMEDKMIQSIDLSYRRKAVVKFAGRK